MLVAPMARWSCTSVMRQQRNVSGPRGVHLAGFEILGATAEFAFEVEHEPVPSFTEIPVPLRRGVVVEPHRIDREPGQWIVGSVNDRRHRADLPPCGLSDVAGSLGAGRADRMGSLPG